MIILLYYYTFSGTFIFYNIIIPVMYKRAPFAVRNSISSQLSFVVVAVLIGFIVLNSPFVATYIQTENIWVERGYKHRRHIIIFVICWLVVFALFLIFVSANRQKRSYACMFVWVCLRMFVYCNDLVLCVGLI